MFLERAAVWTGSTVISKKLCMTEFGVQHSSFSGSHYYDAGAGRPNASFVYVVKGSVILSSVQKRFESGAGSLFYIPEGARYSSVWSGSPDIEFYSMHIISKSHDASMAAGSYALQRLSAMSTPETGARIAEIFRLMDTGERLNKIRALSLYYAFYADVLPYLRAEPAEDRNPVLWAAVALIEKEYALNYPIAELASRCCVSESRLYHIFREGLGSTPVRYRNEIRIERAAHLLRSTNAPIDEVGEKVGFNSLTYFRETFKQYTGLTPGDYRRVAGQPDRTE